MAIREGFESALRLRFSTVSKKKKGRKKGKRKKKRFSTVFLGGQGLDRGGADGIWDLARAFNAFDPVALLAAVVGLRARFLRYRGLRSRPPSNHSPPK